LELIVLTEFEQFINQPDARTVILEEPDRDLAAIHDVESWRAFFFL
jgi:hypothetical protein